jgi:formamidopyrimidine-DNA glycosylase
VPLIDKRSGSVVPELPEVETLRRGLLQRLGGYEITSVQVRQPYLREKVEVDTLQTSVVGRTIADIERRAKYLLMQLRPEASWYFISA